MSNIYVIFSTVRTGSHIILEMLANSSRYNKRGLANARAIWLPAHEKECQEYFRDQKDQSVVIHLHDLEHVRDLDLSTVILILSFRRDLFAQVMSLCVAYVTKEWNGRDYSNKIVEPVVFDKTRFINELTRLTRCEELDVSKYKKVVTIYYEDLVDQGASLLARELNLDYDKSQAGYVYQKSPYSYKDIILNWEELHQEYLKIIPDQIFRD